MTHASDSAADLLATTKQAIAAGVALVDAVASATNIAVSDLTVTDEVDLSQVKVRLPGTTAEDLLPAVQIAATAGHRVTAAVGNSGGDLTVTWGVGGHPTMIFEGDVGELAPQREVDGFTRAISRNDGVGALFYVRSLDVDLDIVIKAPANAAAWVRTTQLLRDRLRDGRWGSLLSQLAARARDHVTVVLVQDAGDAALVSPGLILAGPEATFIPEPPPRDKQLTLPYRARAGFGRRPDMFTPAELVCTQPPTGVFSDLRDAVEATARTSAWYWLAESAAVELDRVTAHFDGVTSIDLDLLPYGTGKPAAEVVLAEWAMATSEPSRADAVQQAITFAVRSTADLEAAATPVLRTARSLYELAGRGLISEALAARRSAREAAITAARAAATAARDVAAKSVERTFALVIAAAVALFANARKFLDDGTSYAIIIALAVIATVAWGTAWFVDTHSGVSLLDAFDHDVELYRDSLGDDDIQATKNLTAITEARDDLKRARITATAVYGVVVAAVLIGGSIAISTHHHRTVPSPMRSTPSTFTTSPTPNLDQPRSTASPGR